MTKNKNIESNSYIVADENISPAKRSALDGNPTAKIDDSKTKTANEPVNPQGISILGLPPLNQNRLSKSSSPQPARSTYGMSSTHTVQPFGILDEFKRDRLNANAMSSLWSSAKPGGVLGANLSSQYTFLVCNIQYFAKAALKDCTLCMPGEQLGYSTATNGSNDWIKRILNPTQLYDMERNFLCRDNMIAGAIRPKLPGHPMDDIAQAVNDLIELRNAEHVRFAFVILTTYEQWRILWLEDTDAAAAATSKKEFARVCAESGSALEHSIATTDPSSINVRCTRVYEYHELELIEVLCSLVYKMQQTLVTPASSMSFLTPNRPYILASPESLAYTTLPSDKWTKFSYQMPDEDANSFYILRYFEKGSDGETLLCCCASTGRLCVVKFLLSSYYSDSSLDEEQSMWKRMWDIDCRLVSLNGRLGLLMPFCFHSRRCEGPPFGGLNDWQDSCTIKWKNQLATTPIRDDQIRDCDKISAAQLEQYQRDPLTAARAAIKRAFQSGIRHGSIKWKHVALYPRFNEDSDTFDLEPILLDMTKTEPFHDGSPFPAVIACDLEFFALKKTCPQHVLALSAEMKESEASGDMKE